MPTDADPTALLAAVPLFSDLSRKDVRTIQRVSKVVSHAAGRTIVEEGTAGAAFHLILEGKAEVSVRGRPKATLRAGDYFGEISLIDRGPRSATVTALTPVRTLAIASWDFLSIVDSTPTIGRKLLVGLCRRIRETEKAQALRH